MSERNRRERQKTNALDWAKKQERSFESTVKLPEGVSLFKLDKVGVFRLDFMPYVVGKNNPRAKPGMEHFEREYDAHRVPTADGQRLFCCRMKCWGKRCAVCDFLRMNGGTADQALVKSLRTTTRHLWVVNDKPGDRKNPLKVFDTNHYNRGLGFGEMLADAITSVTDYANFADLSEGYTIQLNVKEQTFPGGKFNAAVRMDFLPRKYQYPESLLDAAPCLDDLLVDPGYDAVAKLLNPDQGKEGEEPTPGGDNEPEEEQEPADGEEEETPKPKKKRVVEEPEEEPEPEEEQDPTAEDLGLEMGDKVKHEDHGICKIIHVSGDGTSLRLKDSEGNVHKAVAPSEVRKVKTKPPPPPEPEEPEDEDEPPPAPKPKPKVQVKKPTRPPEPDDDDTEDEDELPVSRPKQPAKKTSREVAFDDDELGDEDEAPKRPVKKPGK
jgi:hypothetical protein